MVLSNEEIEKLLKSQNEFTIIGLRNLLAISLMLDAGLRVSEVVNLNAEDVNKELGVIKVFGKGQVAGLDEVYPFNSCSVVFFYFWNRSCYS